MLDPGRQKAALAAILSLLDPESLDIPESALEVLMPRPFGHPANRELMTSGAAPAFDAMGISRTAASMAVGVLLQPERAARLVDFHRRDEEQPGLRWLLDAVVERAFRGVRPASERLAGLAQVVRGAVVDGLIALSSNPRVTGEVRAEVDRALRELDGELGDDRGPHEVMLALRIARYLDRRSAEVPQDPATLGPPPGSPIGSSGAAPGIPDLAGCSWETPWNT